MQQSRRKKDYLKYDLIKGKTAIVPVLYRYFIITEQHYLNFGESIA